MHMHMCIHMYMKFNRKLMKKWGTSKKIWGNELGGVPSWRPCASWDHLGSVLRPFWSVLGASRCHPGARRGPHMDARREQNPSKTDPDRNVFCIVSPMKFWAENGHRLVFQPFKSQSQHCFGFSFFHNDRWEDFEGLNPWKGAPRVHEMLIVSKSSIPILA